MSHIYTNDFLITNLTALSSRYRLHKIRGLNRGGENDLKLNEYYQKSQYIIRKLSFLLEAPVTIIERDNEPYLVVPDNGALSSPTLNLQGGGSVLFEPEPDVLTLDYTKRSPENDKISLRFLEFLVQSPLHANPTLWQPRAGGPFFLKQPETSGPISHYLGFSVRPVIAPNGGLALRVHLANKYIAQRPLPAHIRRTEFGRLKNKSFVYHYGHQWYELKAAALADLNISQHMLPAKDGRNLTLLEYVIEKTRKPIPPELAQVEHDGSALVYYNNQRQERTAIAGLCYQVYGPQDREISKFHRNSILSPHKRFLLTVHFVKNYLSRLKFGEAVLQVSSTPLKVPFKTFQIPDYEFGQSRKLSVRQTMDAFQVPLERLGETRLKWLKDPQIGFFDKSSLGRQYLIVPQSVLQSWGCQFVKDLRSTIDVFLSGKNGPPSNSPNTSHHSYQPIIVPYHDRVPKTYLDQGREILKAVESECQKPGHALVMVHHLLPGKNPEDQLSAMVIRELRDKFDVTAAVIHSKAGQDCYVMRTDPTGDPEYVPTAEPSLARRLSGYLQMVALNKILLLNDFSPFVLATPLHADLTIGIDVKGNTAGLILIDRFAQRHTPFLHNSKQKEKLRAEQIEKYLFDLITGEIGARPGFQPKTIVIHRDGRIWPSEILGINRVFKRLKRTDLVSPDVNLTILEISKSSPAPLRLFEQFPDASGGRICNPQIGQYEIRGNDGYVCTTGRAFSRQGTVHPLHVRKIEGPLPFKACLEDIFYLSTLTWTKPDGCLRSPITTKLNDRYLSEAGTEYDGDSLYFDSPDEEENGENVENEEEIA